MKRKETLALACVKAKEQLNDELIKKLDKTSAPYLSEKVETEIRCFLMELCKDLSKNKPTVSTKRPYNTKTIKILLASAIIAIIFGIVSIAFTPVRNFWIRVYEDCSVITFGNSKDDGYMYAEYNYIPPGYEMIKNETNKSGQWTIFQYGKYEIVITSGKVKNSAALIDTENADTKEIQIKNSKGFLSDTNRSYIFLWSTGKYYHCISAHHSDKISVDDVIKIAESMAPTK